MLGASSGGPTGFLPEPMSEQALGMAWSALEEETEYGDFVVVDAIWTIDDKGRTYMAAQIERGQSKELWILMPQWEQGALAEMKVLRRVK